MDIENNNRHYELTPVDASQLEGGDGIDYGTKVEQVDDDAPELVTKTQTVSNTATTTVGLVPVQMMVPTVGVNAMGQQVQGMAPAIAYQQVVNTQYQQTITTHTFTRIDPGEYEGEKDGEGKRLGYGKCKWVDDSTYAGRWKDDVRWGKGVFKSNDGDVYDGEFVDDIKEGPGKLTYANGKIIVGVWEKDRLNGQGTIQPEGKNPVECIFKEDIIIQQKTQFGFCDWLYFITAIFLMVCFYIVIPVGLISKNNTITAIGGVWVIYIIASCCTNSTKYVCNTVDIKQVFINIEKAIASRPETQLTIQNYHMEDRVTTTTDKDGNTRTRTTKVRVNTHRAQEELHFTFWVDRSPPSSALHYIDLFLLTRIFTYKFVNLSSKMWGRYYAQKRAFILAHHRDEQYDYFFTKDIGHHAEHCLAFNDSKGSKPWFTNCFIMVLLDFVFVGWYQRWKLDQNSVRVEYTLEKFIIE